MKFSEFDAKGWEDNGKYYDTCLIPFTGLTGGETPPETVAVLENLRDFMDKVEIPFQGRVVTYPAVQYSCGRYTDLLNEICHKVKSSGFQYAVVVTAAQRLTESEVPNSDLVLSQPDITAKWHGSVSDYISREIQKLWQR